MAVRQYIGARYVIKVYENSLDPSSAEWEANVTYEPLTMVTYLNSSYLSKKDVPGSVGNPASNPQYWVVTGAYNGQIAALQDQIDALTPVINAVQTNLDAVSEDFVNFKLNNRRVVVITDSYGMGRGSQTPFTTPLQTYLDCSNDDYFAFAEGSLGINRQGDQGHNAEELLTLHSSDITNHNTITDIIFAGGLNDVLALTGLETAFDSFVAYCRTNYPNATVHIAFIGNSLTQNATVTVDFQTCLDQYAEFSGKNRCHYIEGIYSIMFDYSMFISDNIHPTTAAGDLIARWLTAGLCGANGFDYKKQKSSTLTGAGIGEDNLGNTIFKQCLSKDCKETYIAIKLSADTAVTAGTQVTLATVDDPLFIFSNTHAQVFFGTHELSDGSMGLLLFDFRSATIKITPYFTGNINHSKAIIGRQVICSALTP